jgi:hypothetical protein
MTELAMKSQGPRQCRRGVKQPGLPGFCSDTLATHLKLK